jgi:hypothetical protein
MTHEQKQALRKIVSGLGLIVLLAGPLTSLYSSEMGLLMALVIWVIGLPALTLFGFGAEKSEDGKSAAQKTTKIGTIIFIVIAAVFLGLIVFGLGIDYLIDAGVGGQTQTQTRNVSQFDEVELNGGGQLIIEQTGKEGLKITAPKSLLDKITARVEGRTLKLERKTIWWFWPILPTREVVYRLNVDELSRIAIRGSGNVETNRLEVDNLDVSIDGSGRSKLGLDADSIDARISGSGSFVLTGKAYKETIDISGSGDYNAKGLKAQKASVNINGSGDAIVNSQKELDVSISGSGRIRYLGSPSIEQNISGSGSISKYK